MNVLIVDDSSTVRRYTRSMLKEIYPGPGHSIQEAEDGEAALQLLGGSAGPVHLILCDWNMPRMDGITFLKKLKAMSLSRDLHIIMVTSEADRKHVAEALRWGARDFIVKPFTGETLRAKLARLQPAPSMNDTAVLLRALASERSRAEGEPPPLPAPSGPGLTGTLDTLPIPELVQFLHLGRKTGHLRLTQGPEEAGLYFVEGEVRHAWTRAEAGEPAFYRIVGWQRAYFAFDSGHRAAQASLAQATLPLLMEGLRRLDEGKRSTV